MHMREAPLDITAREDREGWAQRLEATIVPTGSLRRASGGAIANLPGYGEGAWWVQDAAAAIPATLFGDIRGKRVLDLCAAPGGKTAQLAAAGGIVTATDRSPRRVDRMTSNLARLNLKVETVSADAVRSRAGSPAAPCRGRGRPRRR